MFTTEEFDYNIEFEGRGWSGSHDSIFDLKIGLGESGCARDRRVRTAVPSKDRGGAGDLLNSACVCQAASS